MELINILLFCVLFPLILGIIVIYFVTTKYKICFNIFELVSYAFGLGVGLLTIYMFLIGWLLNAHYNLFNISFIYILFLIPFCFLFFFKGVNRDFFHLDMLKIKFRFNAKTFSTLCFSVVLICWSLFSSFFIVLNTPTYPDDAFANWNFRAKVIYYTQSLNLDKREDSRLFNGGTQISYPLLNPLFKAYTGFVIGGYDDRATNIIVPLFHLFTLLLLFGFFIKRFSFSSSLLVTALYIMIPLIWIHSINTYTEIVLIFYLLAVVFLIYDYIECDNIAYFWLSGIFAGFLGWVKNEGFVDFYASLFLVLCLFMVGIYVKQAFSVKTKNETKNLSSLRKKNLINSLIWVLISIGTFSFYIVFRKVFGLSFGSGGASMVAGNIWSTFSYHPEVFRAIYMIFFEFGGYNLIPIIFLFSLFFFYKDIVENKALLFLILLILTSLFIFFVVFLFTENFGAPMSGDSRQFLQLIPLMYVFVGILFFKNYDRK